MTLSPAHRRFLLVDQGVAPAVFNLLLNAGIAWLLFRSVAVVPLWGQSSIAGDTLGTAFILPFATALIVSRMVRGQVVQGRIPPLAEPPADGFMARFAARAPWRRGAVLGVAGVLGAALPVVAFFSLAGPSEMALHSFLWFKAGFAALLAAAVTPLIGWAALVSASASPEREATRP
jgi:hypothetical protein